MRSGPDSTGGSTRRGRAICREGGQGSSSSCERLRDARTRFAAIDSPGLAPVTSPADPARSRRRGRARASVKSTTMALRSTIVNVESDLPWPTKSVRSRSSGPHRSRWCWTHQGPTCWPCSSRWVPLARMRPRATRGRGRSTVPWAHGNIDPVPGAVPPEAVVSPIPGPQVEKVSESVTSAVRSGLVTFTPHDAATHPAGPNFDCIARALTYPAATVWLAPGSLAAHRGWWPCAPA